jgi:hypothetical protein
VVQKIVVDQGAKIDKMNDQLPDLGLTVAAPRIGQ